MYLCLQKGRTVLCTASWEGHDKIVELLLRRKADVNHQTMVRFQLTWPSWQYNYCRLYIYIYIYIYTSTSLFRMVQLRWWLHLDKDTSILWASLWIMVHMSIYKIRYPQKSSKWFMHACTYNGAVIQWFYFIMQKGGSALMIACSEGHTAIVQLLLKNDANTNLQALVWILFGIHNVLFTWPVSSLIFVLGIAHTFCVLTAWRNCFGVCH